MWLKTFRHLVRRREEVLAHTQMAPPLKAGKESMNSLPAKVVVESRYADVRPNTTAIIAAIMPGGAIETSMLETTLKDALGRRLASART